MAKQHPAQQNKATSRMEAFSDGVFAIALRIYNLRHNE